MKKYILIIFAFLSSTLSQGQVHDWVHTTGYILADYGTAVSTDHLGNVITVGYFQGTVDFDPSTNIQNETSNGVADILIQKFDSNGNYLWHTAIGGPNWDVARSVDTDAQGNIYVAGIFKGVLDFDPGAGVHNLTASNGNNEGFLLKLNSSGGFEWAVNIGGADDDEVWGIEVDSFGNSYTTGSFKGTVDFNPGSGIHALSATGSSTDAFILKLTANGEFGWAKKIGGTGWIKGRNLALDTNNGLITIGSFGGTADLDPSGITSSNVTSLGGNDIYVQKLDTAGAFLWGYSVGSTDEDFPFGVAIDSSDNIYVTGSFELTANFNTNGPSLNLTSNGGSDIFIEKISPGGNILWAKSLGGISDDQSKDIGITTDQDIIISGEYRELVDFDPGPSINNMYAGAIFPSGFLVKLNSLGEFDWSVSMENPADDSGILGISLGPNNYIYSTGYLNSTADFDPSTNIDSQSAIGQADIFLWKLHSCSPTTQVINETTCAGIPYVVPSGDESHSISGTYNDTLSSIWGCDSILVINLSVLAAVDLSVTNNSPSLIANQVSSTYQWLDCDNGFAPISGETNQSFLATSNGNYAVEINSGGCTDTSSCNVVDNIGWAELENNVIRLYPNPSNGLFTLQLGDEVLSGKMQIITLDGRIIDQLIFENSKTLQFNLDMAKGVYLIHLNPDNSERHIVKFIIE